MSDLGLRAAKALYAKSTVAGTGMTASGRLTKVYQSKPPKDADFPYGVISRIPGQISYLFGATIAKEDDLVLFKVVTDRSLTAGKSPILWAEEMANYWHTLIRGDLVLTGGGRCTWNEKFSDMFPIDEPDKDGFIFHRGFLQRVVTEP